MAIMKWNTPPGGDQDDRRAHVVGHGEGVALVHAVSGDKVQGGSQINALNPNYELATKWSTAPYTGPDAPAYEKKILPNQWGYRDPSRAKKCMGNDDTCNSWATKGSQWCVGHKRQMGLAPSPGVEAARHAERPPKNGVGPVKPSIVADERRGQE